MICVNVFYVVRNEISAGSDKRQRNVFYVVRNEISAGSDKKIEFSPKTPIVKIAHFGNVMSIDMTLPNWVTFTMGGLSGNSLVFCRIKLKFRF